MSEYPVIAFLVKKPAQFDVPFFQWAHTHPGPFRWVVVYLTSPEGNAAIDPEINRAPQWGFNLLADYDWQFLSGDAHADDWTDLWRRLAPAFIITNGYKYPYNKALASARQLMIPLGLRIDSVSYGRSRLNLAFRKIFLKQRYKPFSLFFASGTDSKKYLSQIGIQEKQQAWFPYCTDAAFFGHPHPLSTGLRKQYAIPDEAFLVLGVCKFNARENPMDLVKAMGHLKNQSIHLLLVGDGIQRRELEEEGRAHAEHIHFAGYIPYANLPAYYQAANLFIHPAVYEPWGVSVQEAIQAGIPVIASKGVGSGYDLIVEGSNGFTYNAGKTIELAQKIELAKNLDRYLTTTSNALLTKDWNYEKIWFLIQQIILKKLNPKN